LIDCRYCVVALAEHRRPRPSPVINKVSAARVLHVLLRSRWRRIYFQWRQLNRHDFASERSANLATSRNDSREAFGMNDLILWNELTRREQRIMNKLFGGGSAYGDDPIETVNLMRLGLITESGLTSAGLELFIAAFKAQRDVCRAN
jgi:hypothetical protein